MQTKHIIKLNGKEFILFEGLLTEFFANNGKEINTEELETSTEAMPKFKATVKGERGTFTGHGDANDQNVNSLITRHKYRMAETRAIARALRLYNNIGMCSFEELGGDDKPQSKPASTGFKCDHCQAEAVMMTAKTGAKFVNCPNWREHQAKGLTKKLSPIATDEFIKKNNNFIK